jgi:hypothetical protein
MKDEVDPGIGGAATGLLQHRRRGIDADDRAPRSACDVDGDAPAAHPELDERSDCFPPEADVERDVLGHVGRPLVVALGKPLGVRHAAMVRAHLR